MKLIKNILIAASVILFASSPVMAEDTLKIGFLATLTGEGSTFGQEQRRGALIAIDEINAAGGINGKKLELVAYDDRDVRKTSSTRPAVS